jgi:hypothetical protein
MIRYALRCEHEHAFEGWFASSGDYDDQHACGQLECPLCGSKAVRKAVMAPAVASAKGARRSADPPPEMREMMMQAAEDMRKHVEDTFDYVGEHFADEARAIHKGQTEARGIYGEASGVEVKALVEEGVPIAPLPTKPRDKKDLN